MVEAILNTANIIKLSEKYNFLENVLEDKTEARRVKEIGVDTAVSSRISTIHL